MDLRSEKPVFFGSVLRLNIKKMRCWLMLQKWKMDVLPASPYRFNETWALFRDSAKKNLECTMQKHRFYMT